MKFIDFVVNDSRGFGFALGLLGSMDDGLYIGIVLYKLGIKIGIIFAD